MSESENSLEEDDNTENFLENPTRELLAEGFLGFFSPIVENLDSKVKQTVLVQLNINAQLDILLSIIKDQINRQNKQETQEFDKALKTLQAIKSRVTVLSNVLQTAQDRLIYMNERVTALNANQSNTITEE